MIRPVIVVAADVRFRKLIAVMTNETISADGFSRYCAALLGGM